MRGLQLLREVTRLLSTTPGATLSTKRLEVHPPEILSALVARSLASAFPALTELHICGPGAQDGQVLKAGLMCLLGTSSTAVGNSSGKQRGAKRGGKRGGKTEGKGSAAPGPVAPPAAPLLPSLTSLHLDCCTSTGVLAAVIGSSQLRSLTIDLAEDPDYYHMPRPACSLAPISRMTGLQSLALTNARYDDLTAILLALTGLTKLSLDVINYGADHYGPMLPTLFTGLSGLQSLDLVANELQVRGLEQLTALTHLSATLMSEEPWDWDEGPPPPTPLTVAPVWPLPPRLRSLQLFSGGMGIELLGCLQLPECLERVAYNDELVVLDMAYGIHTDPDGRLLPAMEGALVNALALLARARRAVEISATGQEAQGRKAAAPPAALVEGYDVQICYDKGDVDDIKLLRPPAAAQPEAGAGAGAAVPRGHLPWLEAVAAVRPMVLHLDNIMLDEADLRCIAGMTSLKSVYLTAAEPSFPVGALPLLGSLPRLEYLELSALSLVRQPQEEVAQAIKRLCAAAAPRRLEVAFKVFEIDRFDLVGLPDNNEGGGEPAGGGAAGGDGADFSEVLLQRSQALLARVDGLLSGEGLAPGMVRLEVENMWEGSGLGSDDGSDFDDEGMSGDELFDGYDYEDDIYGGSDSDDYPYPF
ncbi:hypothetical protein GPECTOR_25g408 [Gonium pectorale]|uniref:Uncharacterized protein n=1 Tax=Gonium pectorale TaxID=33097 RepID=A0A150GGA8_GONPE|nr:hypothetical protein GPECTOR_25g408 [Gonium pectorale]|eukprot:KXZ48823.1 hypothetical protein GPECTOR_25g408 [Gonium pectorale]